MTMSMNGLLCSSLSSPAAAKPGPRPRREPPPTSRPGTQSNMSFTAAGQALTLGGDPGGARPASMARRGVRAGYLHAAPLPLPLAPGDLDLEVVGSEHERSEQGAGLTLARRTSFTRGTAAMPTAAVATKDGSSSPGQPSRKDPPSLPQGRRSLHSSYEAYPSQHTQQQQQQQLHSRSLHSSHESFLAGQQQQQQQSRSLHSVSPLAVEVDGSSANSSQGGLLVLVPGSGSSPSGTILSRAGSGALSPPESSGHGQGGGADYSTWGGSGHGQGGGADGLVYSTGLLDQQQRGGGQMHSSMSFTAMPGGEGGSDGGSSGPLEAEFSARSAATLGWLGVVRKDVQASSSSPNLAPSTSHSGQFKFFDAPAEMGSSSIRGVRGAGGLGADIGGMLANRRLQVGATPPCTPLGFRVRSRL